MNKVEVKISEKPLVSVVLCFYNERLFLEEAIQSVLSQDYYHWELLLVDDGSTDESTAQAKAYAHAFPDKIYYIDHDYHQNKGLSASRNAGIKKCRGSYVAFIDDDDVCIPSRLRSNVDDFNIFTDVNVIILSSYDT